MKFFVNKILWFYFKYLLNNILFFFVIKDVSGIVNIRAVLKRQSFKNFECFLIRHLYTIFFYWYKKAMWYAFFSVRNKMFIVIFFFI